MAPVRVFFLGITLSLTYIVNAADYGHQRPENSPQSQSKQSLRDIAIPQRFMTNSQTQNRRFPDIPDLHSDSSFDQNTYYDRDAQQHGRTRIDLRWGQWSDWSLCSRSCGGGIARRLRICNRSDPTTCVGSPVDFILCNTGNCPSGTPTFREKQCTDHSKRLMTGKFSKYTWYPYSGDGTHPCKIYCTAKQVRFIQPFEDAIDGTKCGEDGKNRCIAGECVEVGCDMVVGSKKSSDACGVCGGNNSTCFHYRNAYYYMPEVAEYLNYNEIARIPAGSSHIFVKDYSANYLALMETDDHFVQYIVNGNRYLSWPSTYETAGTSVIYNRTNDTETFEIKGPTQKDLYIMILFMEDEPRIEYDYWIPQSLLPTELTEGPSWTYSSYDEYYDPSSNIPEQPGLYGNDYDDGGPISTLFASRQVAPSTIPAATPEAQETSRSTSTSTSAPPRTFPYSSTPKTLTSTNQIPEVSTNGTTTRSGRRYRTRHQKCKKRKNRKLSFCEGDFAIHAKIMSKRRYHHGSDIRYDIQVKTTYKSEFRLISREYIWVSSDNCPKLRPLREYLLIGRKVQVDVTGGSEEGEKEVKTRYKRYETRLVVEKSDYWATWRKSFELSMEKIANRLQCDKYLRRQHRKSNRQERKTRVKKARNRTPI